MTITVFSWVKINNQRQKAEHKDFQSLQFGQHESLHTDKASESMSAEEMENKPGIRATGKMPQRQLKNWPDLTHLKSINMCIYLKDWPP